MPRRISRKENISELGEFGLISRLRKQIGRHPKDVYGIGDDAAVAPMTANKNLLFTTDMLVEGVHFTGGDSPKSVGHKAIASSISDIAAMGGRAKYAVISLGAPKTCSRQFVTALYRGIQSTAERYGVRVVGGDTVRSPKIVINVAMTGEAKKKDIVYRSGAKEGDLIYVSGPLGQSLSTGRHLRFSPRADEAQYLVQKYKPTAMIDITDGLAADLGHILHESNVGAILEEELLPGYRKADLNNILYDGEDFELLFTLNPAKARQFNLKNNQRFTFYFIGTVISQEKGLQLRGIDGVIKPLQPKGYTHF